MMRSQGQLLALLIGVAAVAHWLWTNYALDALHTLGG